MKSETLIGTKKFTGDSGKQVAIEYYFLKDYRFGESENPLCGIKIVKQEVVFGERSMEVETAPAISYAERFVKQILNTMMRNQVTPIHMLEIIDEFITQNEESVQEMRG